MGKYKISELAQLWGCSVPTVHKRVEKEGYKTVQALDEQNKMVKYVIIDDVENDVNNVVKDVENTESVITVEPVSNPSQTKDFVYALLEMTRAHEQLIEQKNEELVRYKASALLLEEKKYAEGQLIQENRELKREKKDLQKINDYFKYALFASIIVIVALIIYNIR